MLYLFSVVHDEFTLATEAEGVAISAYNEKIEADGHRVFAGGLGFPDTATTIDNRHGEAIVTDGPYAESKEFLAGFFVIEAADLDVAMRLATEASQACNRKIEVRPLFTRPE